LFAAHYNPAAIRDKMRSICYIFLEVDCNILEACFGYSRVHGMLRWEIFHERDMRELSVGLGNAVAMAEYLIVNEERLEPWFCLFPYASHSLLSRFFLSLVDLFILGFTWFF